MIQSKITPPTLYRFIAAVVLLGYFYVASNPTSRSINAYYSGIVPLSEIFFDLLFPLWFLLGAIAVNLFGKVYPYRAIMIAIIPQFVYMALSSGWVIGTYSTNTPTNPVALFTHLNISVMWVGILWRELGYNDAPSTS